MENTMDRHVDTAENMAKEKTQHVFICGAKCLGQYGGFETFLDKLTEQHQFNPKIQYYITTKANGTGCMDETKLDDITYINKSVFVYNNAKVAKLSVPEVGPAQAILYDLKALNYCIKYCEKNSIDSPIFYILACRIGPFFKRIVNRIHKLGGKIFVNPDGHEWKRAKWSAPVRMYWKESERLMVKYADLLVCDSVNIENYIKTEYQDFNPKTTYIAYGSDTYPSLLSDDAPAFQTWMNKKELKPGEYYMSCGRFVPENSFDIMIREFMKSHSKRDFAIITTQNDKYYEALDKKLEFKKDPRIKFVGTVYNPELLKKIRENAYAYFHGHTVGGTNPSLLEALGSTKLNMLINVGFNQEVAQDAALYWGPENGSLSTLIDYVDQMSDSEREELGTKAKERIHTAYSWSFIAGEYEKLWLNNG